jgi:hypothetical protein
VRAIAKRRAIVCENKKKKKKGKTMRHPFPLFHPVFYIQIFCPLFFCPAVTTTAAAAGISDCFYLRAMAAVADPMTRSLPSLPWRITQQQRKEIEKESRRLHGGGSSSSGNEFVLLRFIFEVGSTTTTTTTQNKVMRHSAK